MSGHKEFRQKCLFVVSSSIKTCKLFSRPNALTICATVQLSVAALFFFLHFVTYFLEIIKNFVCYSCYLKKTISLFKTCRVYKHWNKQPSEILQIFLIFVFNSRVKNIKREKCMRYTEWIIQNFYFVLDWLDEYLVNLFVHIFQFIYIGVCQRLLSWHYPFNVFLALVSCFLSGNNHCNKYEDQQKL